MLYEQTSKYNLMIPKSIIREIREIRDSDLKKVIREIRDSEI